MLGKTWAQLLFFASAAILISTDCRAQEDDDLSERDCALDLVVDDAVDWPGRYGRGYEVFSSALSFETVSAVVRHAGRGCRFYLTASPSLGGAQGLAQGPGGSITYDILKSTNGPSLLSGNFFGSEISRIDGQFPDGQGSQSVTLYIAVPENQFVRGGRYSGQAVLRLFRVEEGSPELAAETPLLISIPVASVLEVRSSDIAPGSREYAVDLGDLTRGPERNLAFTVRSNADVLVSVRSLNRGYLLHEFNADRIGYHLRLGGEELYLQNQSASKKIRFSSNEFSELPINISVPPLGKVAAAGNYTDTIFVTFTPE